MEIFKMFQNYTKIFKWIFIKVLQCFALFLINIRKYWILQYVNLKNNISKHFVFFSYSSTFLLMTAVVDGYLRIAGDQTDYLFKLMPESFAFAWSLKFRGCPIAVQVFYISLNSLTKRLWCTICSSGGYPNSTHRQIW